MLPRLVGIFCATLLTANAAMAQNYVPDFDPSQLKGPRTGTPEQVMVLGTPHLSNLPDTFKPDTLDLLINRLGDWKPQAIAIEAVSGAQCDFMRHYPDRYKDSVANYCWDPAPAAAATGLDVPTATAEAERLLKNWPKEPTAAQRRHLASVFLAAGEQASALVQWLRLPESERHEGDGLNDVLVARLIKLSTRHDESLLIAAPLAARLGLERVYAMDDHTADAVIIDEAAYEKAILKAWDNPAVKERQAIDERLGGRLGSSEGVLDIYRGYNAKGMGKLVFDSDFGATLEEPSPQMFGRQYLGYWETRNLRMAGNIRDMLQSQPGIRALIIVGASHKGYLESYLNQMHDVRIVDTETVLK